jgi:autotransporter-associated beta strand protein
MTTISFARVVSLVFLALLGVRPAAAQTVVGPGTTLSTPVSSTSYIVQPLGTLVLKSNGAVTQSGKITLQRGAVIPDAGSSSSSILEITGPIEYQIFGHIGVTGYSTSETNFRGAISGYGYVSFEAGGPYHIYGPVNAFGDVLIHARANDTFHNQLVVAGDFITGPDLGVEAGGWATWADVAPSIQGDTLVRSGRINVAVDSTVNNLVVDPRKVQRTVQQNATVDVASGKKLTVNGDLDFRGGALSGDFQFGGDLVKRLKTLGVVSSLGNNFDKDIVVNEGILRITDPTGVGSTVGATRVASQRAAIHIDGTNVVADDVYLNNSQGFLYAGGVLGFTTSEGVPELTGDLYLGDQGSYVGGLNQTLVNGREIGGHLKLSGAIHGGTLYKASSAYNLTLTNGESDYTGATHILGGEVTLQGNGRLASTSGIVIRPSNYWQATLRIDNSTTQVADRVADTVPIEAQGGRIEYLGSSIPSEETLGTVRAAAGTLEVYVSGQSTLRLNDLVREKATIVRFVQANQGAKIDLPNEPLTNNLIGGWGVVASSSGSTAQDFATLGASGVARYSDVHTYHTNMQTAGPTDNLNIVPVNHLYALPKNSQFNALRFAGESVNSTFDLQAHSLQLESGGILNPGAMVSIQYGTLTSGAAGDLFLHGEFDVSADIVDGPTGPLSVVINRSVTLRGTNTYTGAAVVTSNGRMTLGARWALPSNSDLVLDGGWFKTTIADGMPLQYDTITMRNGNFTADSGPNELPLAFNEFNAYHGSIGLPLSGGGQFIKRSEGTVELSRGGSGFTGQIIVEQGTLIASSGALGGGVPSEARGTIVRSGGVLRTSGNQQEFVVLDGGTLSGWATSSARFEGPIKVLQTSRIDSADGSAVFTIASSITGSGDLIVDGPNHDIGIIDLQGSLNQFTGNLRIEGGNVFINKANSSYLGNVTVAALELSLQHHDALGRGVTTVVPEGGITLDKLTAALATKLNLAGGSLRIRQNTTTVTGEMRFEGRPEIDALPVDLQGNNTRTLQINAPATFADDTHLAVRGQGNVVFNGPMTLNGKTELAAYAGFVNVAQGIIAAGPSTSLNLIGQLVDPALGSIQLLPGASFTLLHNYVPVAVSFSSGGTLSGNGNVGSPVVVGNGGGISPGNSIGELHLASSLTLQANSTLQWEISDALGTPGQNPGWDHFVVDGQLQINTGAPQNFINVQVAGLNLLGSAGTISNFDPTQTYRWLVVSADEVTGFAPEKFKFNWQNFSNNNPLPPLAEFRMEAGPEGLSIVYVPAPAGVILAGQALAAFGVVGARRLRRRV